MKRTIFTCLLCSFILPAFSQTFISGQKLKEVSASSAYKTKIIRNSALSTKFKNLMDIVMRADDCSTKGCDIVDPWTCECITDIKDPWGIKAGPSRLKAFRNLEAAISNGAGGQVLADDIVVNAKKKYPGNSPRSLTGRLTVYLGEMGIKY